MERVPKTIFQLDTPYTTTQWPQISQETEGIILELLCNLLSPIGKYRADHVPASNGKRQKKRKRREANAREGGQAAGMIPPSPEISKFVVVGLNNITRRLESQSQEARRLRSGNSATEFPATNLDAAPATTEVHATNTQTPSDPLNAHFAAIFIPRSNQPPILNAHLPQLIATASTAHPGLPPTRLVQLPKGSDVQLCAALGLPRVSCCGILEGAPYSNALIDLVRERVAEIEIPWLDEARRAAYMPLKVNSIQTSAPVVKKVL
ncbi:hypothetical protein F5884DRAFT_823209 [Xylogone sp. PMI_703]|nr:hypothetical protein F5884DRAFT_823209 [Xylogone sp. PMI_703]